MDKIKVIAKFGKKTAEYEIESEIIGLDEDGAWSHDKIMNWIDTLPESRDIMDYGYKIEVHELEYHWTEVLVKWENCRVEFRII